MSDLTKRQNSKAATRQKVLDAAKAMFTLGYEAATVRSIAEEAGVSTGAVFANFEDKATLYAAIYGHPPITVDLAHDLLLAVEGTNVMVSRQQGKSTLSAAIMACRAPR